MIANMIHTNPHNLYQQDAKAREEENSQNVTSNKIMFELKSEGGEKEESTRKKKI